MNSEQMLENALSQDLIDILNQLKDIQTVTDLRFDKFISADNEKLTVSFFGHQVGGSYVYDYEVAPKYVEDIKFCTNRETKWIDRKISGIMGCDIYYFDIYYKKIINNNPYIPTGKLLRVVNSNLVYVPIYDKPIFYTWSLLYTLHKEILADKTTLDAIDINIKNDIIYIDNIEVCKIVEHENDIFDGHRQIIHAIYDLLIDDRHFKELFYDKYKQLINLLLKNNNSKFLCSKIYVDRFYNNIKNLVVIKFDNGFEYYNMVDCWRLISQRIDFDRFNLIDRLNEYESQRIFVNISQNKIVELYNYAELHKRCNMVYNHEIYIPHYYDICDFFLKSDTELSDDDKEIIISKIPDIYPDFLKNIKKFYPELIYAFEKIKL
jgi:hypothetical protein